jgi:glycosyltransferase involved in cell wall biosynthesis
MGCRTERAKRRGQRGPVWSASRSHPSSVGNPQRASEAKRALDASAVKVLTIAHNAVAGSNRRRTEALSNLPDVDMSLLTPRWWFEEGRRIDVSHAAPWLVGRTLFTGNGTRYVYVTALMEAIRGIKPDVIDLFEEPFSLVALETLLLRDRLAPRAALVFYSAVNVHRQWRWPYSAIERLMLRRADGAHAPNKDVPPILRAKGFVEREKPVAMIPLGVDVERFAAAEPLSLPGISSPRIGLIGRLEPVKGLEVLLDAMHHLTTSASVVIAGEGSEKGRLMPRLRLQGVHIMPPVSYEKMPAVLKGLHVLVFPSVTILPLHREQFGRVLVEAMAAGVPVVGSSSGAIPEVIGDSGLVVPERDPRALAHAIDRVLTEPGLRQTLVERGRRRVHDYYAWPVIADQTLDLFRSAVAHRRQVTPHLQAVGA